MRSLCLARGSLVVVVLDDERKSAHVFTSEGANRILGIEDELTLPEIFGDLFGVRIAHVFA